MCIRAGFAAGGASDGRQLIDAYTIGVEVAIKLGVGIGIDHYERGFHGTSTLGTLGAVAALARARRLASASTRLERAPARLRNADHCAVRLR